jgi:hypothetical protein
MKAYEVMKEQQEERTVPEFPAGPEGEFSGPPKSLLAVQWQNDEISFSETFVANTP